MLLPESDSEAAGVLRMTVGLAALGGLVVFLLALIVRGGIAEVLGDTNLGAVVPFLGLSMAMLGVWQGLSYWANRHGHFRRIAGSMVVQQATVAVVTLSLGLGLHRSAGLIAGTIAGQVAAVLVLGRQIWRDDCGLFRGVTPTQMRLLARRFYRFPLYNLPYGILTTASVRMPVLLLTVFGALAAAGFVGFGRMVIFVPITLVSASLGRVYFRTASANFGTQRLERLTIRLLEMMALVGPPAFALLFVWAPEIFAIVFGAKWREAGELARLLIPGAFCFLFTSWPERLFEVAQRQSLALGIQVVCDTVTILSVASLLARGATPWTAMLVYGVLSVIYSILYLWGIFLAGRFSSAGYFRILALAAFGMVGTAGLIAAVRGMFPVSIASFLGSVGIVCLIYGGLWLAKGEEWRSLMLESES